MRTSSAVCIILSLFSYLFNKISNLSNHLSLTIQDNDLSEIQRKNLTSN